jgi:two-component system sensor histidine kinase KdpD
MAAAVVAATLCFLAYNFFFIPPRFTLYIGASRGVATVFLFLAAALVAGRLASKLRAQVIALRAANAQATALQTLGRQLASAADAGQVVEAGRVALQRLIDGDALLHLGSEPLPRDGAFAMSDMDRAAADWAQRNGQPAGRFTDTLSHAAWWFLPLAIDGANAGLVGLRLPEQVSRLAPEQRRLAEAMTADIADALVRARLVKALENARVSGETERLRSALLSSVSHDLRSPLAAIIGAAGSLDTYGQAMSADDRHSLLDTIRLEGERLDRYIQNLLDMTRLGHGGLTLNRDWIGVDELIGSAVSRLQRYEPTARFDIHIADGLAPLWVHPALVEQAIFNVLENAVKFSPPGEAVSIDAHDVDDRLRIDVCDKGPGIPEEERRRIFDMFFSVERGDRGRQGTGLGLAITQGMVGAHGGSVAAMPGRDGRGTTIRLTLPRMQPSATSA